VPPKIAGDRLNKLLKLAKRKQALLAEMQDIDRRMIRLEQEFRESPRTIKRKGRVTFSNQRRKPARTTPAVSAGTGKRRRRR
jgi:flagellar biosynthesis/type III secretory pathway chaperone